MMQEPTNMFVLCAPIKVLPAGVHIASMPMPMPGNEKNQKIKTSRSMLSVIHDLQTTTRFTTLYM